MTPSNQPKRPSQPGRPRTKRPRASNPSQTPEQSWVAKAWRFLNSNALVVALVSIAAGGIITYAVSPRNQSAANSAVIQGQQGQRTNAQRQYADQVTYGMGPVQGSKTSQLFIENRSGGWVRGITVSVPVPVHRTPDTGHPTKRACLTSTPLAVPWASRALS